MLGHVQFLTITTTRNNFIMLTITLLEKASQLLVILSSGLRFGGGDSSSMSLWQGQQQDQGRKNEIPLNKVNIVQPLSMKQLVEVLSTSQGGGATKVASGVLNVAYTKTP